MEALILPVIKSEQKQGITMQDLDFDILSKITFPIGSTYISLDSSLNPNSFLYGKWELCNDNESLIYGTTKTGLENSSKTNTSLYSEKSYGNTGSVSLDISQLEKHRHTYGWNQRVKKSSSGSETRVVDSTSDPNNKENMLYSGEGAGHSHPIGSHTHKVNIPMYGIYLWIRKE